MRRVLSLIAMAFCVLGALHAGQEENAASAAERAASATKHSTVDPKIPGADKPAIAPRSAKTKTRPDATEFSYKMWPGYTVHGVVSGDTEYGRIVCTSFGKRSCHWE